jgi:hypothetical protein
MKPQDPTTQPVVMTSEEIDQFLETFWDDVDKEGEVEATDDDYFDPSVWESK